MKTTKTATKARPQKRRGPTSNRPMMGINPAMKRKIGKLSPGLQAMIQPEGRNYVIRPETPISNFLVQTKLHCNGGRTIESGLWLRDHCKEGGRIFLTMAGAGSSFQMGKVISPLIRAGKIAGISVTGANLEESLYRLLAHSFYAWIPNYEKLTGAQEKELDHASFRRITDTFLPEEESVRKILPHMERLWREAQRKGKSYYWHEYFFMLFERDLIKPDPAANLDDCWLYWAWKHGVEIVVPGFEDSTMGNVFTYYSSRSKQSTLKGVCQRKPISVRVVRSGIEYMHRLAEWYMTATKDMGLAFVQLGGGIAADFPICVVPHIKKDYLADKSIREQERLVRPWAAYVEIHTAPMSAGSYSGAGGPEKITWSKLEPESFTCQIWGDYTTIFPDIAALVLGW